MVTHSFLQRGGDALLPAEAHDRVDEVEVRQLSVEPFQFDVHSADDVSAQLQVDGGLNRAAATRELASDDDYNTALASAQMSTLEILRNRKLTFRWRVVVRIKPRLHSNLFVFSYEKDDVLRPKDFL